ncbi:MAG: carboxypeptidase-like regulatory domain-containing protein, partial [Terriglobia bacterium]
MKARYLIFAGFIIAALCAPCLVRGQAVGEITGRVTDPSGAVVPNARITATRAATGVSQLTVSSSAGTYTIPHLPVGTYTVTAVASGFKTAVAQDVTLDVSQQRQ